MMKATAWFCPVLLTLLSATRLVCTAQRGAATGAAGAGAGAVAAVGAGYANGYPLDYLDAQAIQDEYAMSKRNKPSLSIVNPLDVLRQRLLLEIARRQMKENTRQVELNRAILKNVGKRVFLEPATWAASRYQQQEQREHEQLERQQAALREQLRREQLQQQHFPSQLWSFGWPQSAGQSPTYPAAPSSVSTRFFDFLQRGESQARRQPAAAGAQLLDDANKSLNANALGLSLGVGMGMGGAKHQQPNGNEIANETNHENGNRKTLPAAGKSATGDVVNADEDAEEPDDALDETNLNWASEQREEGADGTNEADNANGRVNWRLIYRMHNNPHYAN